MFYSEEDIVHLERERDEAVTLAERRFGALDNEIHRGMRYMDERDEAQATIERVKEWMERHGWKAHAMSCNAHPLGGRCTCGHL